MNIRYHILSSVQISYNDELGDILKCHSIMSTRLAVKLTFPQPVKAKDSC